MNLNWREFNMADQFFSLTYDDLLADADTTPFSSTCARRCATGAPASADDRAFRSLFFGT